MAKCFSKKYGNKGSAFNYPVPANFFQLKDADATSLPTSLPQLITIMPSVVRIQQKECLVLCTVTLRVNVSIYSLPSTKGTNKLLVPHCPDKRGSIVCHN